LVSALRNIKQMGGRMRRGEKGENKRGRREGGGGGEAAGGWILLKKPRKALYKGQMEQR
jgi:hypothetical protein